MNGHRITLRAAPSPALPSAPPIVAEQQQRRRAALALDQRIRGQCRGERDEPDIAGRALRKHAGDGGAYAFGKVVAGGQCLGGADDAPRRVIKHGIRVGAASIDAERK